MSSSPKSQRQWPGFCAWWISLFAATTLINLDHAMHTILHVKTDMAQLRVMDTPSETQSPATAENGSGDNGIATISSIYNDTYKRPGSQCTTNTSVLSVPLCGFHMDDCHCPPDEEPAIMISDEAFEQQLSCSRFSGDTSPTLNFFAAANGAVYESFVLLYAFQALAIHHNVSSIVEIVVSDSRQFRKAHRFALQTLLQQFGSDAVCVREFLPETINRTSSTNSYRFMEPPVRHATYTYIGDVDILFTESVLDSRHFERMEHFGIPYSNIIRVNKDKKLAGTMLLKTDEFYTPTLLKKQREKSDLDHMDERYLYYLVNASGLGLPGIAGDPHDPWTTWRSYHGEHLSLNRGPGQRLCQANVSPGLCEIVTSNDMRDFLCRDKADGHALLSTLTRGLNEQLVQNMTLVDGVCQAPK